MNKKTLISLAFIFISVFLLLRCSSPLWSYSLFPCRIHFEKKTTHFDGLWADYQVNDKYILIKPVLIGYGLRDDTPAFLWSWLPSKSGLKVLTKSEKYFQPIGVLKTGTIFQISHLIRRKGNILWLMGESYDYYVPYAVILNGNFKKKEVSVLKIAYPSKSKTFLKKLD